MTGPAPDRPGARIVLASASPRRRTLLEAAGIPFEVFVTDVPEDLPAGTEPAAGAVELARRKARAAAADRRLAGALVLAADTIVAVGEGSEVRLLGKPADAAEARSMLLRISGTRHRVVTGVCCLRTSDAAEAAGSETTWVTMRPIAPPEIDAYVDSGEWEGKAGGYAIQETADRFVTGLEGGGFDNVVGLPVGLAIRLIRRLGGLP